MLATYGNYIVINRDKQLDISQRNVLALRQQFLSARLISVSYLSDVLLGS